MTGQRSRSETGASTRNGADTHVHTIEQQYHVDLVVRRDTHLDTVLRKEGSSRWTSCLRSGIRRAGQGQSPQVYPECQST